jgi:hypothetical protein
MARGVDERHNQNRRIISPDQQVWVDGEPFTRSELWEAAGFKERTPEYLLEKHKERMRRRNG